MTKDKALRLALEKLTAASNYIDTLGGVSKGYRTDIENLKAALETNEFNPDWDTQAVLVEEIQRMAKRIEELEAKDEPMEFFDWYDNAHWGNEDFKEGCHRAWNAAIKYTAKTNQEAKDEPDVYGYAKRLAEAIWSKHYKTTAPQWEPFDELIGVLTQIDNMTAGLISPPHKEAKNEPVAWQVHPFDYGIGHQGVYARTDRPEQVEAWKRKGWNVQPLYTTSPQRTWVGLTDEERGQVYVDWRFNGSNSSNLELCKVIEAKLRSKND